MKLPHRRHFLHLAAGAAALPAVMCVARAQAYPSRPCALSSAFHPAFHAVVRNEPPLEIKSFARWCAPSYGGENFHEECRNYCPGNRKRGAIAFKTRLVRAVASRLVRAPAYRRAGCAGVADWLTEVEPFTDTSEVVVGAYDRRIRRRPRSHFRGRRRLSAWRLRLTAGTL
jgi:hypothetical protein